MFIISCRVASTGLPSGGDWALPYVAAATLNNTASVTLDSNLFTRLDGLGVILVGYVDP